MANTLHQLKRATEIVERYRARGNVFPRELRDCGRGDPESQQEYRDACKVKTWKYSLLGKNIYNCSDEVRDYLNENMPGWCDRIYSHQGQSSSVQMKKAVEIVQRYRERGNVLPRRLKDPTKAQETKDAINISTWKSSLKGYNRVTCSKELCTYLDDNMPGWRLDHHKSKPRSKQGKLKAERAIEAGTTTGELDKKDRSSEQLMPIARAIVERFKANNNQYPSLKQTCRKDPNRAQEYSDAKKLHSWKSHIDKSLAPEVFDYLDTHMPAWKNSHVVPTVKNIPVSKAREIYRRCSMRNGAMPVISSCTETAPAKILEHKDAIRLREWRISFLEQPADFCPVLKNFLDEKISGWRNIDITTPLPCDKKAEKVKSDAKAAIQNRKMDFPSTGSPATGARSSDKASSTTSTDDEQASSTSCSSSHTSSNGESDDGYYDDRSQSIESWTEDGPASKKSKISTFVSSSQQSSSDPINSDDFAGITALLQLSAGSGAGSEGKLSSNSVSTSQKSPEVLSKTAATVATPAIEPEVNPMPLSFSRPSSSFSTYGHGKNKRPLNSLYSATSTPSKPYTTPVNAQGNWSKGVMNAWSSQNDPANASSSRW